MSEAQGVSITAPDGTVYNVTFISISSTQPLFAARADIEMRGAVMPPPEAIHDCILRMGKSVYDGLKMGVKSIDYYAGRDETEWNVSLTRGAPK